MAMFIKFRDISDKDLKELYIASGTIVSFYFQYFGKLGIPLEKVFRGPEEYEGAKSLLDATHREMKSRGLIE